MCDLGGMTVDVHHESFADNMMVNMTVGCTNETRVYFLFYKWDLSN